MFSVYWLFIGSITGLLVASVFAPPVRKDMQVPLPHSNKTFNTPSGCVKFRVEEVECVKDATSLNLLASEH